MKKSFIILLSLVAGFFNTACEEDDFPVKTSVQYEEGIEIPEKAVVVAEQSRHSVLIVNSENNEVVWSWDAFRGGISSGDRKLFENPSEAKPVCNNKYILMTASGGAVALIRVADHKMMCYTKCGDFPNPHSAELLPDGNIVVAESRNHEVNIIKTDFEKGKCEVIKDRKIGSAHNVVWDKDHKCLFLTGVVKENGENTTKLFRLDYNNNKQAPKFFNQKSFTLFNQAEPGGHDLFPVYGEKNKLWLTTANAVYKIDVTDPYNITPDNVQKVYNLSDIKSVSNGPEGILMIQPTTKWWSNQIIDEQGNSKVELTHSAMYKARWMINNTFSYPENHDLK